MQANEMIAPFWQMMIFNQKLKIRNTRNKNGWFDIVRDTTLNDRKVK